MICVFLVLVAKLTTDINLTKANIFAFFKSTLTITILPTFLPKPTVSKDSHWGKHSPFPTAKILTFFFTPTSSCPKTPTDTPILPNFSPTITYPPRQKTAPQKYIFKKKFHFLCHFFAIFATNFNPLRIKQYEENIQHGYCLSGCGRVLKGSTPAEYA